MIGIRWSMANSSSRRIDSLAPRFLKTGDSTAGTVRSEDSSGRADSLTQVSPKNSPKLPPFPRSANLAIY